VSASYPPIFAVANDSSEQAVIGCWNIGVLINRNLSQGRNKDAVSFFGFDPGCQSRIQSVYSSINKNVILFHLHLFPIGGADTGMKIKMGDFDLLTRGQP